MPYLDGKKVNAKEIIPGKHILVGKFRDADFNTFIVGWANREWPNCPCGASHWASGMGEPCESIYDHWAWGHFDENVYKTIEEK